MMYEKITEKELEMIDYCRKHYGFLSTSIPIALNEDFAPIDYILREWEAQKKEYLFDLLGKELIINKKFYYEKTVIELEEDISRILFTSIPDSKGRIGKTFADSYCELVDNSVLKIKDNYSQSPLYALISRYVLAENKYTGRPFEIDLPSGKILKINSGDKPIKILSKIAKEFNLPRFEDFRILHSKVLNQKKVEGTLSLSIHPLDYITMSDNNCHWHSCMSWKGEGDYRQGTVEMMNSNCVVVAYITSEKPYSIIPEDEERIWNNKKWRELFIINKDIISAVKDYPYNNENFTIEVMNWLKELAEKNLNWNYDKEMTHDSWLSSEEEKRSCFIEFTTDYMYNDYESNIDTFYLFVNSNNILNKAELFHRNKVIYNYSGLSECMICGKLDPYFDNPDHLACMDCEKTIICCSCDEYCRDEYCRDEYYEFDGQFYCPECYSERIGRCESCDEEEYLSRLKKIQVIPRFPKEKSKEILEDLKIYISEIFATICDECLKAGTWEKENLLEGKTIHKDSINYSNNVYVYFDDLNETAKNYFIHHCLLFDSSVKTNEDYIDYVKKYHLPYRFRELSLN